MYTMNLKNAVTAYILYKPYLDLLQQLKCAKDPRCLMKPLALGFVFTRRLLAHVN